MSGFLGQILGNMLGGQSQQVQQGLPAILTQLLSGQSAGGGGLQGLLGQLTRGGLGPQVQSWVGSGQNMPVEPEQLRQALPQQDVDRWAQQTGTSSGTLLSLLSQVLPHAVDQATPGGQMPEGQTPEAPAQSGLGAMLGGAGLSTILMQLFSGQSSAGGLQGLLGQLSQAGLGSHVQSWVGTGQNMPVSPEQLGQALPQKDVDQWAQQVGTTPNNLLAMLSQALPHAVDQATPGGEIPAQGTAGSLLGKLFGKA